MCGKGAESSLVFQSDKRKDVKLGRVVADLQRKELGLQVGELRTSLATLKSEHEGLLPPAEEASSPDGTAKGKQRATGEGSAAAELVAALKLVVDSLEALSQRML